METPLDYSFYSMTVLQDMYSWDPRPHRIGPKEVTDNEARTGRNQRSSSTTDKAKSAPLSKSKCFKLNNNNLPEVTALKDITAELFEDPDSIALIDLSFNELTKIDDVLLDFPNLQMLYLHGNAIANMAEIEKLARIPNLKKLSLHGNPVENDKTYKYTVLSLLPELQVLDFSRVTKADRRTASTLEGMNRAANKRAKRKKNKSESETQ